MSDYTDYISVTSAQQLIKTHCPCTCHEAYTSRKLTDPNCIWHNCGEEIEQGLNQLPKIEISQRMEDLHQAERIQLDHPNWTVFSCVDSGKCFWAVAEADCRPVLMTPQPTPREALIEAERVMKGKG